MIDSNNPVVTIPSDVHNRVVVFFTDRDSRLNGKQDKTHCFPFCNMQIINSLQIAKEKTPFCIAEGRLLPFKRAPFTLQKGIFYITKGHLSFYSYEYFLQKQNIEYS